MQHRIQVADHLLRARQVRFGDHEDVGNLQDAGFESLDTVSQVRRLDHDGRLADCADIDAVLSHADRLDQDQAEAHMREQVDQRRGGWRQPAFLPARGLAAHEQVWIAPRQHPYPVAQHRAAAYLAGGIDQQHRDSLAVLAQFRQEMIDQRALAGAGWTGDPDHMDRQFGLPKGIQRGNCVGPVVLDQCGKASQRGLITRPGAIEQSHR